MQTLNKAITKITQWKHELDTEHAIIQGPKTQSVILDKTKKPINIAQHLQIQDEQKCAFNQISV